MDPVATAIMANRLDAIVREMSNTLLRTARSAVINSARDFSCSIVTKDDELLAAAEGLPVHTFGSHLQTAAMREIHPTFAEGDAFLHNDPYLGNTHAADHTILVPVFFDGQHMFTAVAKAHQADIGNSIPTTYHATARDVYQEGALVFPCVQIERDYQTIQDIIRMCEKRIRVPGQWYGDFLAMLGAARIGERRLKAFCEKYGLEATHGFVKHWLNYSEERTIQAIRRLPRATLTNTGGHDPFEGLPAGISLQVVVDVDPERAMIEVDLRDNPDCVDCGLNESEACTISNVVTGIFNCIEHDIPHNAGTFRRITLHLRDNCIVGRPQFPHSCSMATTNVGERLVNMTQSAFCALGEGYGVAEGGLGGAAGDAVVSGKDFRRNDEPYVNQLFLGGCGGPGCSSADGWLTYGSPVVAGLMYRDSVELAEIKQPLAVHSIRLLPGSFGAGKYRGAPGTEICYGTKRDAMHVEIASDGQVVPVRGVRGGHDAPLVANYLIRTDGERIRLSNSVAVDLQPGEVLQGLHGGGAGYGNPLERDPEAVRIDVLEGWETHDRAMDIYGVVLRGCIDDETLEVDHHATSAQRRLALSAVRPAVENE